MLRPGADRVGRLGGLHRMMNWPGPILTDSGGFQVMSLAKLRTLNEEGVIFQSHIDGSRWTLTPEGSTRLQHQLDATISMAFDECTPWPVKKISRPSLCISPCGGPNDHEPHSTERCGYGQFIVQGSVFQICVQRAPKPYRILTSRVMLSEV